MKADRRSCSTPERRRTYNRERIVGTSVVLLLFGVTLYAAISLAINL